MSTRKTRLVECNPAWDEGGGYLRFDCPEGHANCFHIVPFTPDRNGQPFTKANRHGAIWKRSGDTFETLTLSPSIRRTPMFPSRAAAAAWAGGDDKVTDDLLCALHINITNGGIFFHGDSR